MLRLHPPREAAEPALARRWPSWAMWLGAVACVVLLGAWFFGSRMNVRELQALSAEVTEQEARSPPLLEQHPGLHLPAALARQPASSAIHDAPGVVPEVPAASKAAVFVAGSVVELAAGDVQGAPFARARLYVDVQWRRAADGRLGPWTTTPLRAESDADGGFTLAQPEEGTSAAKALAQHARGGEVLAGLRVTARAVGYADAHATFAPGARDVRLVLARAGSLSARIVHGGGEDGPDFTLALAAGDELPVRTKVTGGSVLFGAVPPGEASLTLWLTGDPEPLAVLRGLSVPIGAPCEDPRLDPLDVSERVAVYSVRVVNDRGEAVPEPVFHVVGARQEGVNDEPRWGLRARVDVEATRILGEGGWWRVHARAPAAPDVVVTAIAHDPSATIMLRAGAVVTLRSEPRFSIELAREPPGGECSIELEQLSAEGTSEGIMSVPASRAVRWVGGAPCKARARLVQWAQEGPDQRTRRRVAAGPWVEFEVPDSGEGRALLDLSL